ncbi:hypothetical protein [Bacteroides xylanisolvens]|uniref:hypothetical protein n=1 Tax=Bacteroides xylanisolvens TaxID=371601 RepID=UPI00189AAB81|nr:hypothetical protein [Bacteroides xylanisolvens]
MVNMDKNIPPNKYDIDALFMVSDKEILETSVSSEIMEEAEAAREKVFDEISKRIEIETTLKEDVTSCL